MNDLITSIRARVEGIVATVSYPSPGGGSVHPEVFVGGRPQSVNPEEPNAPFVLLRLVGGSDSREDRIINVHILSAVYTDDDVEAGVGYINDITLNLLGLQRYRGFVPYKLIMPVKWRIGDESGQQPHPYYYSNIDLQFKGQPLADRS